MPLKGLARAPPGSPSYRHGRRDGGELLSGAGVTSRWSPPKQPDKAEPAWAGASASGATLTAPQREWRTPRNRRHVAAAAGFLTAGEASNDGLGLDGVDLVAGHAPP